jgi:uncharacterized protein YcbX
VTPRLAQIWRHPIKSHGREALAAVTLAAGQAMPWDRHWAVAHAAAKVDPARPEWAVCGNFSRGSKSAALMAINATLDADARHITLTHPDRPKLAFHPDDPADAARFIDWVRPLVAKGQPEPAAIVALPGRGMTDTDYPSVSLINIASNAALGGLMGTDLSPLRWRGNLWLDGLGPWLEFDWVGRTIRLGAAVLEVKEPIVRCRATTANPATGRVDADTLAALMAGPGHQHFGIYARVIEGGTIRPGDAVAVI